jgi:hypothetical protein
MESSRSRVPFHFTATGEAAARFLLRPTRGQAHVAAVRPRECTRQDVDGPGETYNDVLGRIVALVAIAAGLIKRRRRHTGRVARRLKDISERWMQFAPRCWNCGPRWRRATS